MRFLLPFQFLVLLFFSSCSLLTKKGKWGKDAFWPITGARIGKAFKKNISSPHVWVPLAGAGATFWGGVDRKISHWASEKTPIFGSQKNASKRSDELDIALLYEMYTTPLLTASNADGSVKTYAFSKLKGFLVTSLASQAADQTRDALSYDFGRERPNKADHRSFPSGHSTQAGTRNTLTSKNLDHIPMSESLRTGFKAVNNTLAAGVLWGRLEAKRHYPSDVLTGYALGSFISGFIYDAVMNLDDPERPETIVVIPGRDTVSLQYTYTF